MMQQIQDAVSFIQAKTDFSASTGIILGTGLGQLAKQIKVQCAIPYSQIPHMPTATVESHSGQLLFGTLGDKPVIAMQGRFHYYEGYSLQQVTFPVRVLKLLGVEQLFISNAAGGLNPDFALADLMLITDHINLLPENPLRGSNLDNLGPRFPDMYESYSLELREKAKTIAAAEGISINEGVYVSVPGPNLETPAEYNYLRTIGADAVGMSTVPEVIVARHMNMPVCAISVITDLCYPEALEPVTIEKVLAAAAKAEPKLTQLLTKLVNS